MNRRSVLQALVALPLVFTAKLAVAAPKPVKRPVTIPWEDHWRMVKLDDLLFGPDAWPGDVFLNPYDYATLRKHRSDRFDPATQAVLLISGYQGELVHPEDSGYRRDVLNPRTRSILCSKHVPTGMVLCITPGRRPHARRPEELFEWGVTVPL